MRSARSSIGRPASALFAALAAFIGVAACTGNSSHNAGPVHQDPRPNIVFVLTDDLSTNLMPYMPHVQALGYSGVTFRNYFVVDSLCCPSRSAIFTGLYPHDDGVYTNSGDDGGYDAYNRFGNPAKSFAVALHGAGYRTGFMGKYLNGYQSSDPPARGWDEWDVAGNGYREFNYRLNENGSVHSYGGDPQDYLTDVLAGKASDFISASRATGKPFALEVATFAPHKPPVPAPRDNGTFPDLKTPRGPAFDRLPTDSPPWLARHEPLSPRGIHSIDNEFRRRVESVEAVDRMVGRLERTLALNDELDNTYFVFSSDNGYHTGEYRLYPGKQTAFDTDIRVPLVVAGPGVPVGSTVTSMASSIDLAPTFLQIAGAQPADTVDGTSLLGLMKGEPPPPDWQRAVLIEHHQPVPTPDDPDRQPPNAGKPPSYEAMRTAGLLYVEYVTGDRDYFDLNRDPYELHNLAGTASPQRLADLHRWLQELVNCHGTAQCQRAAAPAGV
jgi:N-acetylglucosamine-6-sulfatase